MTEIDQLLHQAADLIDRGWCQGARAQDANGTDVSHNSPYAVAWCATGAIYRVMRGYGPIKQYQVLKALTERIGGNIIEYNDTPGRTAQEVAGKMRCHS